MSRKDKELLYKEQLAILTELERQQKHRRKYIARLRREFEAMPIIVDERPDESLLKAK